jgi:N-acetylneuraminic acid mutarotase
MLGGATSNVYVYRVEMEVWEQVASMSTARAYFQVVMHRGLIYAVGGEDEERV